MSSPRLRRLRLDFERLGSRFQDWPAIQLSSAQGDPPEKYQVTYRINGLHSLPNGQIVERNEHVVEINLSLGYPRRAPQCKMLTPIFHPNFDEASVCIGDFWAASEGLDDLVIRIGRMIAFQEYNTKSPLNGLAAKWAAENARDLPVDLAELAPPIESLQNSTDEKLVIQFENDTASLSANDSPAVPVPALPVGVPRLDFGMIAVALSAGRTTIGRAPDNAIQLIHDSVSSHHAELIEAESGILFRDLGSTNGSTLNNSPVTEVFIQSGDLIGFGNLEATFFSETLNPNSI